MTDVLNLALKKEIFERLTGGELTEIPIEKTNWWKKRLMDVDTGRFKPFAVVSVSCGSSEKFLYPIEKIELRDDVFYITITQPKDNDEEEESVDIFDSDFEPDDNPEDRANDEYVEQIVETQNFNPEIVEPITVAPETVTTVEDELLEPADVNPVTVNEDGSVEQKQTYARPNVNVKEIAEKFQRQLDEMLDNQENIAKKNDDVKIAVWNLLNEFCKLNDVYVVNMPNVTIRFNGQILGCKKRLIADRDNDVRFNFKKEEFIKYETASDEEYVNWIANSLKRILSGNYVFINKNACGFRKCSGNNLVFVLSYIDKKRYLFKK